MKTKMITDEEISLLKISSLPTRPTAPTSLGGKGFSSAEMKAAFDRLPLFIISRFNSLIEDILSTDEGSFADSVMTGISDDYSLRDLFCDIKSGKILGKIPAREGSLATEIARINARLDKIEQSLAKDNSAENRGEVDE